MSHYQFTSLYPFGGLGLGALGFMEAVGQLGGDTASFKNLGGIDLDPDACADFTYLTKAPSLCADIKTLTPAKLRAFLAKHHGRKAAARRPDICFSSPPCKGFSRLLGNAKSQEKKYRELNELVYAGILLMCETWDEPPPMQLLENVPGIVSRGAEILEKAQQVLRHYGYVFHRATHDCGEIGGLAQHRKRFLLIARRPERVQAYVYQPPKERVRACGEVLQDLPVPIPGSTEGGEIHRLPNLSLLNWVRLALIPAGGDWRDLPKATQPQQDNPNAHRNKFAVGDWADPAPTIMGATRPGSGAPSVADPRLADAVGMNVDASKFKGSPGLMGVLDWEEPSNAVTGSATVSGSNGRAAIADPRLGTNHRSNRRTNQYKVRDWNQPAGCVTGDTDVQEGAQLVADPRVGEVLPPVLFESPPCQMFAGRPPVIDGAVIRSDEQRPFGNVNRVTPWTEPVGTITSSPAPSRGGGAVADPRLVRHLAATPELLSPVKDGAERRSEFPKYDVRGWDQAARTVAGSGTNGGYGVADPRLGLGHSPNRGTFGVNDWADPAKCVRGRMDVRTGPAAIADPRDVEEAVKAAALGCAPRNGAYGVMSWQEAAKTITGSASIDNGTVAVADPRKPPAVIPIIIAADGCWHRPLTTLELAVLQSMPDKVDGKPLKLSGKSIAGWRERIGNAVPRLAAKAIARTALKALLASALGTWFLSPDGEPIWVRDDGTREDEFGLGDAEASL